MNGLFPQFVGWWGSIPTSFRCFRPKVLLILTTLWPRDYHTFLLLACTTNGLLAAQTNNPTTCAILRTPSILGLMHHLHDLTFLWLYAPGSWGKITLSLNVSNMSKNHLFLCCLNFLSFLLTSIYNRYHTKLNTLTKLFCNFLLLVLFQIFIWRPCYYRTLLLRFFIRFVTPVGVEPTFITPPF